MSQELGPVVSVVDKRDDEEFIREDNLDEEIERELNFDV